MSMQVRTGEWRDHSLFSIQLRRPPVSCFCHCSFTKPSAIFLSNDSRTTTSTSAIHPSTTRIPLIISNTSAYRWCLASRPRLRYPQVLMSTHGCTFALSIVLVKCQRIHSFRQTFITRLCVYTCLCQPKFKESFQGQCLHLVVAYIYHHPPLPPSATTHTHTHRSIRHLLASLPPFTAPSLDREPQPVLK